MNWTLFITASFALAFGIVLFGVAFLLHKASKEKEAGEKAQDGSQD
ncbi:hypothetical protein JCM30760_21150 [Thiomicrorhabdus hydrogeniphila]